MLCNGTFKEISDNDFFRITALNIFWWWDRILQWPRYFKTTRAFAYNFQSNFFQKDAEKSRWWSWKFACLAAKIVYCAIYDVSRRTRVAFDNDVLTLTKNLGKQMIFTGVKFFAKIETEIFAKWKKLTLKLDAKKRKMFFPYFKMVFFHFYENVEKK